MKKVILGLIFMSAILFSCKKDDDVPTCPTTVAGIAANFKITKVELVGSGGTQDVTSTFLSTCAASGLYQLKADKTAIYTEAGSSCTDSYTGTWDVVNNNLTVTDASGVSEYQNAPIASWNCTTLVVDEDFGGVTYRTTFTKQ